jgi:hypothetical protein
MQLKITVVLPEPIGSPEGSVVVLVLGVHPDSMLEIDKVWLGHPLGWELTTENPNVKDWLHLALAQEPPDIPGIPLQVGAEVVDDELDVVDEPEDEADDEEVDDDEEEGGAGVGVGAPRQRHAFEGLL